jgi:hypothetical protein
VVAAALAAGAAAVVAGAALSVELSSLELPPQAVATKATPTASNHHARRFTTLIPCSSPYPPLATLRVEAPHLSGGINYYHYVR